MRWRNKLKEIHTKSNETQRTTRSNAWSKGEDNLLTEIYLKPGFEPKDIMERLPNRTWTAIVLRASHLQLGSRRKQGFVRKYKFDFNFFEQIDNAEKAYWLGFIFADGSLRHNTLRFGLVVEGKIHLQKLASILHYTGPLRYYPSVGSWNLELTHPKFAKDLRDKGVVERKTWLVSYPNFLPKTLHRHFIRGVFDGDGSITTGTTKYRDRIYKTPYMNICGAVPEFLQAIVDILSSEVGVGQVKVSRRKYRGQQTGTWAFSYSGTPSLRIRDYLYKEGGVYMNCKRDAFYSFGYSSKRPQDKQHQYERVNNLVQEKGGTLLSDYAGYRQQITIRCKEGHVWKTKVRTLKEGAWCPKCRDKKSALKHLQVGKGNLLKWIASKGWQLLSDYKGNEENIMLKCEHGKTFTMMARSVKYEHAQCDCIRTNTLSYGKSKLINYLKEKGWELVSDYNGTFEYVKLRCQHGKDFSRLPANLKSYSKCECIKTAGSGFRGVYLTHSGMWQARIRHNGNEIFLGTFPTKEQSAKMRDKAIIEYGISAELNLPIV